MRLNVCVTASVALFAWTAGSSAADWNGVTSKFGNAAGCAFRTGNLPEAAVILDAAEVGGGGRLCTIDTVEGTEERATFTVNCDDFHSNLRWVFETRSEGGAKPTYTVYGFDAGKEWRLLDRVRRCE